MVIKSKTRSCDRCDQPVRGQKYIRLYHLVFAVLEVDEPDYVCVSSNVIVH